MAYCALADLKLAIQEVYLIQLTDDDEVNQINTARITEAITAADALIDSYLGARYAVPLSSTPAIVEKWSVDIAIYNLYKRSPLGVPETWKDAYDYAIKELGRIQDGGGTLGIEPEPASSGVGNTAEITSPDTDRTFTRSTLTSFRGGY